MTALSRRRSSARQVPVDALPICVRGYEGRPVFWRIVLTHICRGSRACVVALDAAWGYGKTTFLNMWAQWLRNESFPVVAFNAWETDFTNHPFLALSSELTKELESCIKTAPIPGFNTFKSAAIKLLRVAIPAIPQLAGSLLPGGGVAVEAVLAVLSKGQFPTRPIPTIIKR